MEIEQLELPGMPEPDREEPTSAAADRFNQELGSVTENLAYMLRKPTETRPFVYEVRFDLLPAKSDTALVVCKGFGAEGGLVAFHNAPSFLQLLRGLQGQMMSGKLGWFQDKFVSEQYSKRLARYTSGEFYRQ